MALSDVSLSDTTCDDRGAEVHRQLIAAYERIEELEGGIRGLLGLITLLNNNPDIPERVREHTSLNHRVIDAQEMLRP
jgi:hypothetical protein